MNPQNKWLKILGIVIHVLIAGLMLFAGLSKVAFPLPPEAAEQMKAAGLTDKLLLIGTGEIVAAVLLLLPWTSPLGTLMTSGFWGGVICFHLTRNEPYLIPSLTLALLWLASYLRGSTRLWCAWSPASKQEAPLAAVGQV